MSKIDRSTRCVQEAIDEIAALNPTFSLVKMTPNSFIYFLRSLGANTKLFCEWEDKKARILHYYTGAADISIKVDLLQEKETAQFVNPETNDVITVRLSG